MRNFCVLCSLMTRYFIPGVDKDFKLTRSEFAKFLGVTVNCLKLRMRRGLYGTEYVINNGKYLFRLPKRNGDLHVPTPSNEPTTEPSMIPGPEVPVANKCSAKATVTPSLSTQIKNHVNRGATHAGKTNYHSNMEGLKRANDIKALNKIRSNLGDEYTDEINDEVVMIARRNVAAKKEAALKAAARKNRTTGKAPPQMVPYGGGRGSFIPNRYGGFMTRHELGRAEYKATKRGSKMTPEDWAKKYYG